MPKSRLEVPCEATIAAAALWDGLPCPVGTAQGSMNSGHGLRGGEACPTMGRVSMLLLVNATAGMVQCGIVESPLLLKVFAAWLVTGFA